MNRDKAVHVPLLIAGFISSIASYIIGEVVLYFCGTLPTAPLVGLYPAASVLTCGIAIYIAEHIATGNYTLHWSSKGFRNDSLRAVFIFTVLAFLVGMGTQFLYDLLGRSFETQTATFQGSVIVFDTSGSMQTSDAERAAIDSICSYIDTIPDGEKLGLTFYNTDVTVVREYTAINGTNERERLKETVRSIVYDGNTSTQAALMTALGQIEAAPGAFPGIVLLFSDGQSSLNYNMIRSAARSNLDEYDRQIPVNTIYYTDGPGAGGYQMSRIARDTGGHYMTAGSDVLRDVFNISRKSYKQESLNLLEATYGERRASPLRILMQALFIAVWGLTSAFAVLMILSTRKLVFPFFMPKVIISIVCGVLFALLLLAAKTDATAVSLVRVIPAVMIGIVICPSFTPADGPNAGDARDGRIAGR